MHFRAQTRWCWWNDGLHPWPAAKMAECETAPSGAANKGHLQASLMSLAHNQSRTKQEPAPQGASCLLAVPSKASSAGIRPESSHDKQHKGGIPRQNQSPSIAPVPSDISLPSPFTCAIMFTSCRHFFFWKQRSVKHCSKVLPDSLAKHVARLHSTPT